MSEQLRRPRPSLPQWDVLLVVFELADAPALALLGRVSYDFLVATAPHLYRDVVLRSLFQNESMFCEREEKEKSPSSRINPLVNLEKIQSLTLDFLSTPPPSSFFVLELSFDRIASFIPLETLFISLPRPFPERYLGPIQLSLFIHLDPRLCEYRMEPNDSKRHSYEARDQQRVGPIHSEEPSSLHWSRIKEVTFVGIVPFMIPQDSWWRRERGIEIAFLPRETLVDVELRFDVYSIRGGPHSTVGTVLQLLALSDWFRDLNWAREVYAGGWRRG